MYYDIPRKAPRRFVRLETRKKAILETSVDSNHVSYDIAVAHLNDDSQLRKTDIVEAIGCKQTWKNTGKVYSSATVRNLAGPQHIPDSVLVKMKVQMWQNERRRKKCERAKEITSLLSFHIVIHVFSWKRARALTYPHSKLHPAHENKQPPKLQRVKQEEATEEPLMYLEEDQTKPKVERFLPPPKKTQKQPRTKSMLYFFIYNQHMAMHSTQQHKRTIYVIIIGHLRFPQEVPLTWLGWL